MPGTQFRLRHSSCVDSQDSDTTLATKSPPTQFLPGLGAAVGSWCMAGGLVALPCRCVPFDAGGIPSFAAARVVGEVGGAVPCDSFFYWNSSFEELSSNFSYSCSQSLQSYRYCLFHFKRKHHQELITTPSSGFKASLTLI